MDSRHGDWTHDVAIRVSVCDDPSALGVLGAESIRPVGERKRGLGTQLTSLLFKVVNIVLHGQLVRVRPTPLPET